jgi:hypothetical protein
MTMNAPMTKYAEPQARTRLDNVASGLVLATMLASVLAGAFVAETDATQATGPAQYATAAEVLA